MIMLTYHQYNPKWYNFIQNSHNRHPIAHPGGWAMGGLLWAWSLIYVLLRSSPYCMWYHDKLDHYELSWETKSTQERQQYHSEASQATTNNLFHNKRNAKDRKSFQYATSIFQRCTENVYVNVKRYALFNPYYTELFWIYLNITLSRSFSAFLPPLLNIIYLTNMTFISL